jgi:hypothetical protein
MHLLKQSSLLGKEKFLDVLINAFQKAKIFREIQLSLRSYATSLIRLEFLQRFSFSTQQYKIISN